MIKVSVSLHGLHGWFGGDYRQIIELVRLADTKGVDCVTVSDHLFLTSDLSAYPGGALTTDYPWFEPIAVLGAIASITERIRLSTSILLAPLRPAPLLAKQLATLDLISRGRVDAGFGVGWHKPEFDAVGAPWEHRFSYMIEQVEACRALWRSAPASFAGKWICFDDAYALPAPVQNGGPPIWFGFAPTERNIERMATHADGWLPMFKGSAIELGDVVDRIHAALEQRSRDPASFGVRMPLRPVKGSNGRPDLNATLDAAAEFIRAGVTVVELLPVLFCKGPEEFEALVEKLVAIKR